MNLILNLQIFYVPGHLRFGRVGDQRQQRVHEPLHLATILIFARRATGDVELYPSQNFCQSRKPAGHVQLRPHLPVHRIARGFTPYGLLPRGGQPSSLARTSRHGPPCGLYDGPPRPSLWDGGVRRPLSVSPARKTRQSSVSLQVDADSTHTRKPVRPDYSSAAGR